MLHHYQKTFILLNRTQWTQMCLIIILCIFHFWDFVWQARVLWQKKLGWKIDPRLIPIGRFFFGSWILNNTDLVKMTENLEIWDCFRSGRKKICQRSLEVKSRNFVSELFSIILFMGLSWSMPHCTREVPFVLLYSLSSNFYPVCIKQHKIDRGFELATLNGYRFSHSRLQLCQLYG